MTMVLVYGWTWDDVVARMVLSRRVLRYDLRGRARSVPAKPGPPPTGTRQPEPG
jgi:hypothetical protein